MKIRALVMGAIVVTVTALTLWYCFRMSGFASYTAEDVFTDYPKQQPHFIVAADVVNPSGLDSTSVYKEWRHYTTMEIKAFVSTEER